MDLVILDFETYYDREFSLSKITTEEYVRSSLYETIGVAVKVNKDPAVWFSGTKEEIKEFLDGFNLGSAFVVGHNMRFDAAILAWRYGILPAMLGDTMGMAQTLHGLNNSVSLKNLAELYGIGAKGTEVTNAIGKRREDFSPNDLSLYGEYCINDVELTHQLFRLMLARIPKNELKIIDITLRMFTDPMLELDKDLLVNHLHEVRTKKEQLLQEAGVNKEDLMSNPKFAEVLRQHNVEPPTKISPTTGKEAYAFAKTDEGFQALLEHENPVIQTLAAARLGNKSTLEETRTEQFINIANRGRLAVPLKYAGATVTHRWSGVESINVQNMPRNSPLRKAIQAPAGYKIVASDLSNIELRLAYWFAGSTSKIDLIRNGVDLYKASASETIGIDYDDVDKDLRYVFKVVNLSGIFGVGAAKMHSILKQGGVQKELDEVKHIVYSFRDRNPELGQAWNRAGQMLQAVYDRQEFSMGPNGIITSQGGAGDLSPILPQPGMLKPNGILLGLPNLRKLRTEAGGESWVYDKIVGRSIIPEYIHASKTFQRCIQSLARDIIAEQAIEIAKVYKIVLLVHDEIVVVCKDEEVDDCVAYVKKAMTTPPSWCADLPLACEVGIGENYKDVK